MCVGVTPDPTPMPDASAQDAVDDVSADTLDDADVADEDDAVDVDVVEEDAPVEEPTDIEEEPEPECLADSDCEEGQWCDAGLCLDGCRDDEGCVLGKVCQEHQCVVGCADDARCPLGKVCLENQCTSGCRQDDQCGNNKICLENQCERGCRQDDQCRTRYICLENQCERGCRGDANCPEGEICMDGQCAEGCRMDAVCPDDQFCDPATLACADGCRAGGCEDGALCDVLTRQCVEGVCESSAECAEGQYCDMARRLPVCAQGCDADGQCGPKVCDLPSHTCVCRSNEHCGSEKVCVDNACVPACNGYEDCPRGFHCDSVTRSCAEGCLEDDFEPNDDPFEAVPVTQGSFDGAMCYEPEGFLAADCYQIDFLSGTALSVSAFFEHARGDMDLVVYDQEGDVLQESATTQNIETLTFQETPGGRYTFCVEPRGEEAFQNPYTLDIVELCRSDEADVRGDLTCQQSKVNASLIPVGQTVEVLGRTICEPEDVDHESWLLSAGDLVSLSVSAQLSPEDGQEVALGVSVVGPDCEASVMNLRAEPFGGGSLSGQFVVQNSGIHTLRVEATGQSSPVVWDAFVFVLGEPVCLDDALSGEVVEPNNGLEEATGLQTVRGVTLDVPGMRLCDGDEDWYAVDVQEPGDTISAWVSQLPDGPSVSVSVLSPDGNEVLALANRPGIERTAQTPELAQAGTYLLRVFTQDPVPVRGGFYNLKVQVAGPQRCSQDAFEGERGNETISTAGSVQFGSLEATVCAEDVDWYSVTLEAGQRVNAWIEYDHEVLEPSGQLTTLLFGPEGGQDLQDFFLHQRQGQRDVLTLHPDGVIITEANAGLWHLKVDASAVLNQQEVPYRLGIEGEPWPP